MADDEKKTVAEWERERGLMLLGKVDDKQKVTADEMQSLIKKHDYLPVDFEDRERDFRIRGIKNPSREQMINPHVLDDQPEA